MPSGSSSALAGAVGRLRGAVGELARAGVHVSLAVRSGAAVVPLTIGGVPIQYIATVVRLLPGVIGNAESLDEESHSHGLLEHPQYTRPQVWQGLEIPAVLTSGNHAAVAKWRREQAEALTRGRRPDLWAEWLAGHSGSRSYEVVNT